MPLFCAGIAFTTFDTKDVVSPVIPQYNTTDHASVEFCVISFNKIDFARVFGNVDRQVSFCH